MFTSSLPDQQTHGEMETFMPHPVSLAQWTHLARTPYSQLIMLVLHQCATQYCLHSKTAYLCLRQIMSEQSELSSKKYVQPATAIAARHTPLNHLHSMTAHKIDSKCEYTFKYHNKIRFFLTLLSFLTTRYSTAEMPRSNWSPEC